MTETEIVRACLDYLHLRGIEAWRQNQGAIPVSDGGFRRFNGRKGIADISGILPQTIEVNGEQVTFGNRLEIEVKQPGKKLRPDQAEFLAMIEKNGGIALLVHSVEELQAELEPFLEAGNRR